MKAENRLRARYEKDETDEGAGLLDVQKDKLNVNEPARGVSRTSIVEVKRASSKIAGDNRIAFLVPEAKVEVQPHAPDIGRFYAFSKRVIDLTLGIVLLTMTMPIVLIAAVAVRLDTPGSPIFLQTRLGKNGRPFRIVKLRGMYADARTRFPSYYDYSGKRDLEFCFHHEADPRVTRAGRFIRRTSIDELPNFWNVVMGDMSLVGPRPEIPEVMALYGVYQEEYLSVKPGVTCLSKITGRDTLTKRETIEFDLDYVRKRGFAMDMGILWTTFKSVLLRRDVF